MKHLTRLYIASLAVVIGFFAISASAQTSPSTEKFPNVKIKNFGQMDTDYYRGGQPKEDEYASLKALGITTVIDLQIKPTKYEKSAVEALGMKYINIPMEDTEYPKADSIETFLKIINDPATGPAFVHCKGGRHRTGVTGAAYRFTKDHWNYDQAYQEMLNYDFDTKWGKKPMKDFVVDYAAKMKHDVAAAAPVKSAVKTN
jgi:protein tyrosine/serine phosphatase